VEYILQQVFVIKHIRISKLTENYENFVSAKHHSRGPFGTCRYLKCESSKFIYSCYCVGSLDLFAIQFEAYGTTPKKTADKNVGLQKLTIRYELLATSIYSQIVYAGIHSVHTWPPKECFHSSIV
jgi:hypothetical protein